MLKPDDLVEVYSTDNESEAEILRAALHAEGLKCEIAGKSQAGFTGLGILEVKLFVRAEDFDRARAYLEKHEQPPPD